MPVPAIGEPIQVAAAPVVPPAAVVPPAEAAPVVPSAAPAPAPAVPAVPAGVPNPLAPAGIMAPTPVVVAPVVEVSPYEKTGNPNTDAVLAGFHKSKVSEEDMNKVMETGILDGAALAGLEAAYGADVAAALKVGVEADIKANKEYAALGLKTVHDAFGGESQWNEVKTWASTALDPAVKDMLSMGLDAGGQAMEIAISQIKAIMLNAGKTVAGTPAGAGIVPTAPTGVAPIDFQSYINQKRTASQRGDTATVQALEAQGRAASDFYASKGQRWIDTKAPKA